MSHKVSVKVQLIVNLKTRTILEVSGTRLDRLNQKEISLSWDENKILSPLLRHFQQPHAVSFLILGEIAPRPLIHFSSTTTP
jgi:hypothetical protein